MGFRTLDVNGAEKVTQGQTVFALATTGNVDDLDFGNADVIRCGNPALTTIRGLKAGADGQRVLIVSRAAGEVDFAHQNSGSTAANRLINFVTSGITPLAPGAGAAVYEYDATTGRWVIVAHEQGAAIAVAYSAGNFTASAGTWTVDAGDVGNFSYYLKGRHLSVDLFLSTTSVSATPATLNTLIPNGYTVAKTKRQIGAMLDNGTGTTGFLQVSATGTTIGAFRDVTAANWATAVNTTYVLAGIDLEIT